MNLKVENSSGDRYVVINEETNEPIHTGGLDKKTAENVVKNGGGIPVEQRLDEDPLKDRHKQLDEAAAADAEKQKAEKESKETKSNEAETKTKKPRGRPKKVKETADKPAAPAGPDGEVIRTIPSTENENEELKVFKNGIKFPNGQFMERSKFSEGYQAETWPDLEVIKKPVPEEIKRIPETKDEEPRTIASSLVENPKKPGQMIPKHGSVELKVFENGVEYPDGQFVERSKLSEAFRARCWPGDDS